MKVLKQFKTKQANKIYQESQPVKIIIPDKVPDLIKMLDNMFPPKCIQPEDNLQKSMFYSGKRDLIDWIKIKLEQQ